ncbi:hypothetical protein N9L06_02085 [Mariniblastus sp.]|nr:hypothetical protein [Mariniblastus sp.]
MKHTKALVLGVAVAASSVLSIANTASAQLIQWQESVPMFDITLSDPNVQTFVDRTGNLAVGYNASNNAADVVTGEVMSDVIVNGVPFTGTTIGTTLGGAGTETIRLFNSNLGASAVNEFTDGNFDGDPQITNLIAGGSFELETVTLGGLESGVDYVIQVFTNDARDSRNTNSIVGFGDGAGSTEPVATSLLNNRDPETPFDPDNPDPSIVLNGNSIIGTFTATSATLTFNVFGSGNAGETFSTGAPQAQINAIQLRRDEEVLFLLGDFNGDSIIDCDDLDGYINNIDAMAIGDLDALDFDRDGSLSEQDAISVIEMLIVTQPNGVTGTFRGDLNCDGSVSVLGDAFVLVANLNTSVASYSLGDINFDGSVSVLGDAFIFVANLNQSNQ